MGSNSSSSSSSSSKGNNLDYYGDWKSSKNECSCSYSDKKVTKLGWYAAMMSSTGTRVGLGIGRGVLDVVTLGMAEIGFKGKTFTHDSIDVHVNCKNHGFQRYTLEWTGSSHLYPGYYASYEYEKGIHYPSNMTLSNLEWIKNNYGSGDCKDHAAIWWEKIKTY